MAGEIPRTPIPQVLRDSDEESCCLSAGRSGQTLVVVHHDEIPPMRWADRYDAIGATLGVMVILVVLVAGGSVWSAVLLFAATVGVSAFALRRRAGVRQVTLWQRAWYRRRRRRS